uniref:DUF2845 domain-containing protein n=1 Tax=viral metagenome TaxID=1070528 RepID=A0A6H1Z6Z3_9ZZZZ
MKKSWKVLILGLFALAITSNADAGMRCDGGFVHQGASKAEVLDKCGRPIFIDGTIVSSYQVWTYNDDGIYRYLHFRGNKLDWIEDGNLVR